MTRFRMGLEVGPDTGDTEQADGLRRRLIPLLAHTTRVLSSAVEPNDRAPGQLQVTFVMQPTGDPVRCFEELMALTTDEWLFWETDAVASWRRTPATVFLAAEVRWAHLWRWSEAEQGRFARGDRVQVVSADPELRDADGRTGTITELPASDDDLSYTVRLDEPDATGALVWEFPEEALQPLGTQTPEGGSQAG
jgi:hypothetical protein